MKMIFDLSSVIWNCLMAQKDSEGYEALDANGKTHWVNTCDTGYEYSVNQIVASLKHHNCTPIDAIFVEEGMNAKARRLMIHRGYKDRGSRPKEQYDEFNKLKLKLIEEFRNLGACFVKQDNVESDDVIAWLCKNTEEDVVIHSADNDLLVLVGTNEYGAKIDAYIGKETNFNKYGSFDFKYITLYKALVGDTSDKIPGITGFGAAKWDDLETRFGEAGMAMLVEMANKGTLDELAVQAQDDKLVALLYNNQAQFLMSWRCAMLHPEWVETMQDALEWIPGIVLDKTADERLKPWAATKRLITANRFDEFFQKFSNNLASYGRDFLSLDIETSTPYESDEWLTAQGKEDGVDTIGSELSGMSLTFGPNMNFTVYIPVDHHNTDNVPKARILDVLKVVADRGLKIVIHNTAFEGPVLFNEFGKLWKDNGYSGFIPNWLDTKIEASYVDENFSLGLKKLSKRWLNYDQTEYDEVTTLDFVPGAEYRGKSLGLVPVEVRPAKHHWVTEYDVKNDPSLTLGDMLVVSKAEFETFDRRKLKMRELTATHVFNYACDDTITTAALHVFFKLFMQLEHTYAVYEKVEIGAAYLHAQSFTHGTKISLRKLRELQEEDKLVHAKAWTTLRTFLLKKGWEGSNPPVYSVQLTPANIKEAYQIVTGEPLQTQLRKVDKLIELIEPKAKILACLIKGVDCGQTDFLALNTYVASHYKNEPVFNPGSTKDMQKLFYDVLELPVRVYNKPTDKMKAEGLKNGTPKTDNLAISYGLFDVAEEKDKVEALEAIRLMKMVKTREGLYYEPYPNFVSWKDKRIHSSHNQCATNTRRASSSMPNIQQLAKNGKIEGYSPKIRNIFVPHKPDAVIVSMDFSSQEILLQAEWCRDPALLEVFIGENPKDMHSITGVKIFNSQHGMSITYEEFKAIVGDKTHKYHAKAKAARALGKAVNFGSQYRIAAKKLSSMLFVTEEEAQVMLDAKADAFKVAEEWALKEMAQVKVTGKVTTMLGAVRHLRSNLLSRDRVEAGKAERQAISFRIQGSAAEMTKLAEGRMWDARLEQRFDCEIIAPCHDEVIASVAIKDLKQLLPVMHECMVANYAGMTLPIKSSISFGRTFGEQIEIGDLPTEEAIEYGLAQLV